MKGACHRFLITRAYTRKIYRVCVYIYICICTHIEQRFIRSLSLSHWIYGDTKYTFCPSESTQHSTHISFNYNTHSCGTKLRKNIIQFALINNKFYMSLLYYAYIACTNNISRAVATAVIRYYIYSLSNYTSRRAGSFHIDMYISRAREKPRRRL